MLHDLRVPAFDVDALDLGELRQRQSAKYQRYEADVIPAWVAEMDFPLAPPIAEALHAAIDRSDTGYRSASGLVEALVGYADATWGWQIPPDRVVPMPDVLTGVAQSLLMLTAPGEGVVINPPVYPPFYSTIRDVAGRVVVEVPMSRSADGTHAWDLAAMEEAFARPEVTAYVLCNPHNPTGRVATRAELEAIVDLSERHGVVVISDEIHGPLALPGATHLPYAQLAAEDANAVFLVSASKAWNLPGLKCAQLVGTSRTASAFTERMPLEVTYGTGHLGVIAAVAAYEAGQPWLDDVVSILDGNRRLVTELLDEHLPLARYVPPEASYLAWIDLREYGLGDDPAEAILDRSRVALSAGPTFGTGGAGYARLNMATSPTILHEIVRRMGTVVQ